MRKVQNRKLCIATIIFGLLALGNIIILIFRYGRGECLFVDFNARWQESAYLFRGINPFDALTGKNILSDIGQIDPDMVTVPWAWILGSIINPGFFPYSIARIWGMFAYLLITLSTSAVCFQYMRENYFYEETEKVKKIRWCMLAVFIVVSQYCWVWSFMCGNQGALACCFTVMAVCIYRKHPILGGVLMLFAMIKPQVAAIFLLTFLIIGEFKLLLTALLGGIISFVVIYLQIHVGIIELLQGTLQVGTDLNYVFFGMFNMLKYYNVSTNLILLLDMIVGISYMIILTLLVRKKIGVNSLDIFMGASIASTFWFYKQSHDYVILIIPCLIFLGQFYKQEKLKKAILPILISSSYICVFYLQTICRRIVSLFVPSITEQVGKELFMTLTCIFFFATGCYYVIMLMLNKCK